ncbi:uncharacterized protein LOC128269177 [Anopheles cruzii]|uniref:uncharacterized protein LOC128269177 n=1 Tax=Anopheles cruzii TaxID=68878 RepID=UPI0022EC82F2|nr:uncharacterized protein LOC128269177 [Anopheles cruzii]
MHHGHSTAKNDEKPVTTSSNRLRSRGITAKFPAAREGQHSNKYDSSKNDQLRPLSGTSRTCRKPPCSTKGNSRIKRQSAQDRLNKLRDHLQQELLQQKHSHVKFDCTKPKTLVAGVLAKESCSRNSLATVRGDGDSDMNDPCTLPTQTANTPPEPVPMEWEGLKDPASTEPTQQPNEKIKQEQSEPSVINTKTKVTTNYLEHVASFDNYMFLVLDSCVYMNEIDSIVRIFDSEVPISKPQPILVVPYKVLQELESLKNKKHELWPAITKTNNFLHSMLKKRDKRIKGQRPADSQLELFELCSPDDSILNCALQVKKVAGAKVVLVSEDCNLLTKALVGELKAYKWKEFCERYDF